MGRDFEGLYGRLTSTISESASKVMRIKVSLRILPRTQTRSISVRYPNFGRPRRVGPSPVRRVTIRADRVSQVAMNCPEICKPRYFGHAIGEVALRGISGQVVEGKHSQRLDRFARSASNGSASLP